MNKSLVLEGGAMRGMYTAGVLDVFLENKIEFDCITGVSAGALFGVNFLSGQKGRVIRYNKRFNGDKNYMGIHPLIKEGNIVSTRYAYYEVPRKLDVFDDEAFKKNNTPFYAVVTDIDTGNPEYIKINSVFEQMDVLRASGSMPFVSKPVEINGKKYLDGGISESIPFSKSVEKNDSRLVVILTRDINYRKKAMSPFLINFFYGKMPNIKKRLLSRHEMYNTSIEKLIELEKIGKAFVIRPSEPIEIGRIEKNPDKLQAVYDLGVSDAKKYMNQLKAFLAG